MVIFLVSQQCHSNREGLYSSSVFSPSAQFPKVISSLLEALVLFHGGSTIMAFRFVFCQRRLRVKWSWGWNTSLEIQLYNVNPTQLHKNILSQYFLRSTLFSYFPNLLLAKCCYWMGVCILQLHLLSTIYIPHLNCEYKVVWTRHRGQRSRNLVLNVLAWYRTLKCFQISGTRVTSTTFCYENDMIDWRNYCCCHLTLCKSLLVVVVFLGRLQDGAPLHQHLLDVLLSVAARQLERSQSPVVGQVHVGAAATKKYT